MEPIIISFKNSLNEIMVNRDISIVQLGREIGADPSTLHRWFDKVNDVKLKTLIKLANYFECSLEYLCGKTHDYDKYEAHVGSLFSERIKDIMIEYKLTPYSFLKQIGITPSKYYYWLSGGEPMLTSLETMAQSLDITLDKLVGR